MEFLFNSLLSSIIYNAFSIIVVFILGKIIFNKNRQFIINRVRKTRKQIQDKKILLDAYETYCHIINDNIYYDYNDNKYTFDIYFFNIIDGHTFAVKIWSNNNHKEFDHELSHFRINMNELSHIDNLKIIINLLFNTKYEISQESKNKIHDIITLDKKFLDFIK